MNGMLRAFFIKVCLANGWIALSYAYDHSGIFMRIFAI
jgi:hypothetical protein